MASIPHSQLNQVKKLYYKQRLSVSAVAITLKCSVDAAYYFMRRNGLTRRNGKEHSKVRFESKPNTFNIKQRFSRQEELLCMAGTMLYWGEGFQSVEASGVDFSNSKPEMVLLFLNFLRTICGVQESKLRAYLYCYSNQNSGELIEFWSKRTKIPKKQFTKPYIRSDFDKAKIDKMKYGLLHVRYYDIKLLQVIRNWIEKYANKFGK